MGRVIATDSLDTSIIRETPISFRDSRDLRVAGLQTTPPHVEASHPAILLVHGFQSDNSEFGLFDGLTTYLTKKGFAVYRFNFQGCGVDENKSEGEWDEVTFPLLGSQLEQMLRFVRGQDGVDGGSVGIVAHSMGTALTAYSQVEAACYVMSGSMADPYGTISRLFGRGFNESGLSRRATRSGKDSTVGSSFWFGLEELDLPERVRRIKKPLLFIHSEKDRVMRIDQMEAYLEKANGAQKSVIPGRDHTYQGQREEMYGATAHFLLKNM